MCAAASGWGRLYSPMGRNVLLFSARLTSRRRAARISRGTSFDGLSCLVMLFIVRLGDRVISGASFIIPNFPYVGGQADSRGRIRSAK